MVGVSGELSLGHAGFMSIGAFAGSALALALQSTVTLSPLRLALAMVFGAVIAAALGFLIGIPVLRLNGDYLAIVTLAFGEIIKSIITNVYLGVDENGLQFSFLSNKNELADGGVELIRGPMGVMNTQRISTFIAGFVLVLVAWWSSSTWSTAAPAGPSWPPGITASPPRAWASASPSTR